MMQTLYNFLWLEGGGQDIVTEPTCPKPHTLLMCPSCTFTAHTLSTSREAGGRVTRVDGIPGRELDRKLLKSTVMKRFVRE